MSQSFTTENLQDLFTFPFTDPNWQSKFIIGSLISFAGMVTLFPFIFVYGYAAQLIRQIVIDKEDPFLPEWDDWGKLAMDGLKMLGLVFIYMIPILIMFVIAYGAIIASTVIPVLMIEANPSGNPPDFSLGAGTVIGLLIGLCFFGLAMLFSFIFGFIVPVGMIHIIVTDDFGAGFRIGEWWAIFRANFSGFVIAYIIIFAMSMAFSFVMQIIYITFILCIFIPFIIPPATFYMTLMWSTTFAQAYRTGVDNLGLIQ